MGIFTFMAVGFVVGLVARALTPGARTAPVSLALFGGTGSFVGVLVGCLYHGRRVFELHGGGTLGGILVVYLVLFMIGVRARGRRRRAAF